MHTPSRWLISDSRYLTGPTLYCFAHGGGSAAEFAGWAAAMPGVDVRPVQLPGRGSRLAETPFTDMTALVRAFCAEVPLRVPFAFFGHSLGALVAYEITRALRAARQPLPQHLFVSARPAPHLPRRGPDLHLLPDDELVAAVAAQYGGIPDAALSSPEYRTLMARPLRADYQIHETYHWQEEAPLPVPVTVLWGRQDAIPEPELAAWGEHTSQALTPRAYEGGHFYLREQAEGVCKAVRLVLVPLTA